MTDTIFAFVIHPVFQEDNDSLRNPDTCLREAVGLAEAIGLSVSHAEIIRINNPKPATLFGQGRVDGIRGRLAEFNGKVELVIVDGILSPVQHRNLEKELDLKVLDRTALILEIFGARAQTKEGRLQVDLAHLTYQRSRLVRSWTHLERQRGGAGFLGGPGERQIESDRRILSDKVARLRRQLDDVRRTRALQRRKRQRAPHLVVALIGYTNAGKSTLFNRLTDASVMAEDQLFATLDPTMRALDLASATRIILSDTVGFISNLPTQLVAAFRATLEEVLEADLILHVRDISQEDTEAQKQDVLSVLDELGIDDEYDRPVIEVWNKTDLIETESGAVLNQLALSKKQEAKGTLVDPNVVPVSALTGRGLDYLYEEMDRILTAHHRVYCGSIEHAEGAALAWLHENGEVLEVTEQNNTQAISVRLSEKTAGQFEKQFSILLQSEKSVDLSLSA